MMLEFFGLLQVFACKSCSQRCQGVFQVAVVTERLDQKVQRSAVFFRQAQSQRLTVQMILQRLLVARQFSGVHIFAVVVVVFAGGRIAAPFAVIRRTLDRAITLPAFFELGLTAFAFAGRLGSAGHPVIGAARCRTFPGRILKILDVLTHRHIRRGQTKLLPRSRLIRELQKRVLVQHLLDFLAQLQR